MRNRARPYVQALIGKVRDAEKLVRRLKAESPSVISEVLRRSSPVKAAVRRFAGSPFPTTYNGFLPTIPTVPAESLATELVWTTQVLVQFSDQINVFLAEKRNFESALVAGDLDAATNHFDAIIQSSGLSLWSIETCVLLAQLKGGLKENRKITTNITEATDDYLAKVLTDFVSQRAENAVTAAAYEAMVNSSLGLSSTHWNDLPPAAKYLVFKLHPSKFYSFTSDDLKSVLSLESSYAIVDCFLAYARILTVLATHSRHLPQLTQLHDTITLAADAFDDPRLTALSRLLNPTCPILTDPETDLLIETTDAYTSGDYAKSIDCALTGIQYHPASFDFYDLYAKSLTHSGSLPPPSENLDSLRSRVLSHVHLVTRKGTATKESLSALLKIAYVLHTTRFGEQLFAFVAEHDGLERGFVRTVHSAIHASAPSARFSTAYSNPTHGIAYLDALAECYPRSISIALFRSIHVANVTKTDVSLPQNVPPSRASKYTAIARRIAGDLLAAVAEYRRLLSAGDGNTLVEADAICGLFECYLDGNDLKSCLELVLETYFRNQELLTPVPLSRLSDAYNDAGAETYSADLSWAVFCYIYFQERNLPRNDKRLFVALDNFLAAQGLARPSQLRSFTHLFRAERLIFLLANLCIPDVLDSSIEYSSTTELEQERIEICRLLAELDPERKDIYAGEIACLTQAAALRDSVNRVDHSKVYVHVPGIRRALDASFGERFDRYRQLYSIEGRFRQSVHEVKPVTGKRIKTINVIYVDAVVDLFSELFLELRDRYISSNEHGLDSYLSLRVRHGTLAGQIRSTFERYQLITTKNTLTGKYNRNEVWGERLGQMEPEQVESILDALEQFSEKIDSIIDEVKNRWIQVRSSSDKPGALFDFNYSEVELVLLYDSIGSSANLEEFLDLSFKELNARANRNLHAVQTAINSVLRDRFLEEISVLDRRVLSTASSGRRYQLSNAISACRTDIQRELSVISAWFDSIGVSRMPDFTLGHLVDTSATVTRRAHPAAKVTAIVDETCRALWPGTTFAYLLDAMYILLDNAIKHSGELPATVAVEALERDGLGILEVRNALNAAVDVENLRTLLPEFADRANRFTAGADIRREGGTGYFKLGKLLSGDLIGLDGRLELAICDTADSGALSYTAALSLRCQG